MLIRSSMTNQLNQALADALWKIFRRPEPLLPWPTGSDQFWRDPTYAERIVYQHVDDTHGAASRDMLERLDQIDWLWAKLALRPGMHLFDVTCGPGLYAIEFARLGCKVTGNDFNPAAIAYAKDLALIEQVAELCTFVEEDILAMNYNDANFDGAMLLYGVLAALRPAEAQQVLGTIARSLKPGARLCLELLNQDNVDKENSSWWFTDDSGLWGDEPFLHLGERVWHEQEQLSVERYHIVQLQSGELINLQMTDQTYSIEAMTAMLQQAGFGQVDIYPAWDGLPLADAEEWVIYIAKHV